MVHPIIFFCFRMFTKGTLAYMCKHGLFCLSAIKLARDSKLTRNRLEKLMCNHVHMPNVLCSVSEVNVLFRATVHRVFIKIKFDGCIEETLSTQEQFGSALISFREVVLV